MKINKSVLVKHICIIAIVTTILSLCIMYPFLVGEYDSLALPLSIIVQVLGVIGIPFSIVGLLWLAMPKHKLLFVNIILYTSAIFTLVIAFIAMLSAGKLLGIIIITIGTFIFIHLKTKLKEFKKSGPPHFSNTPYYLVLTPFLILMIQFVLAKPLTQWSRNRAIENANEFIGHLKDYHIKYGTYPASIQALHKDYCPQIAGIEKYHYLQYGDSYNISFEQPRFLFDVIGTRELVVYNPKDENRAYNHASWFLTFSPQELERTQGWYTSGNTEHAHWKYFLFD